MSPHCLQFVLLSLCFMWELMLGFVMLLMMYSYLTSMTSAVIKGIKCRKNLPLSLMEEEMSLNTCMGKINREKRCWFLQSFLGVELCFNAFSPIAKSLKQRIHGISKDKFLTWLRSTDTNRVALSTKYFLHFVSVVRNQGCNFFWLMNYACTQ